MCAKALPRDLSRLTRQQLYELAQSHRIPGRSTMGREELIAALTASEEQPRGAPRKPATRQPQPVQRGLRPGMKKRGIGVQQTPADKPANDHKPAPTSSNKPKGVQEAVSRPVTPTLPTAPGTASAGPLTGELPESYGSTGIVLQIRDPYWGHVFWEIGPQTRAELRARLGETGSAKAVYLLRIYDVTGRAFNGTNAAGYQDLMVLESAGNWYLHLGKADHEYIVDLGIITPAGIFITVAHSNRARTPRDQWSSTLDQQWRVAEEVFRELYRLSGGWSTGGNSENPGGGS